VIGPRAWASHPGAWKGSASSVGAERAHSVQMKILDAAETRNALPFGPLIAALRTRFAQGCEVPLRHMHSLPAGGGTTGTVLLMPAWTTGGYFGLKTVMVFPGNASRGLPALHSAYVLYDASTGVPLAQMDGNEITSRRTVAASALAASFVARPSSRVHLTVGAGRVGRLFPQAYREVLPIDTFLVWDRTPAHAQAVVEELRQNAIAAEAVGDLDQAVSSADIISCATLSTEPLIHGALMRDGSHLDLVGSFTPEMREADDDCFAHAHIYVDTDEAQQKSGDLLGPLQRGVITAKDVRGTLATLCRGSEQQPRPAATRTVFKSVGTALEDLAAAVMVYEGLRQ
jgi:ornithine cyclodeaminase/alanine dehydrogenase-like protein (mu-crystallin family)